VPVGMIGIGILGHAVTEILLDKGFDIVVHDIRPDAAVDLAGSGAIVVDDVASVGSRCEVVLVLVQTDAQCRRVLEDLFAHARSGTVVALLATIHPSTAQSLAEQGETHGLRVIDAPLAGKGAGGVRAGEVWILAGGDVEAVESARPVLEAFAAKVVSTGLIGSGAALKLAHNVVVYLTYLAVAEGLALARAAGVDEGVLSDVTRASSTLSGQAERFLHALEGSPPDPGDKELVATLRTFADILEKDLRHAVHFGKTLDLELPGANLVSGMGNELYRVPDPDTTKAVGGLA
jgi:3-hydroxyisobutyrate dehydrogenase-like beta-hydroxyacid dehydrogenase